MKLWHRRREASRSWMISIAAGACALAVAFSGLRSARADNSGAAPPPPAPAPAAPPAYGAPPPPPAYAPPPPPEYSNRPLIISDWPENEPAPAGYHWGKRVRRGAIIAGASLLGSFYFPTALIGAVGETASNDSDYAWLYLPGLGPFIEITNSTTAIATVALIIDGAAQSAGIALLVWGITSPAPVLVRNQVDAPRVLPVPMVLGKNGTGMGLVGTF